MPELLGVIQRERVLELMPGKAGGGSFQRQPGLLIGTDPHPHGDALLRRSQIALAERLRSTGHLPPLIGAHEEATFNLEGHGIAQLGEGEDATRLPAQ